MKILYGVCGEGMGHCTRASIIAEHLLEKGHKILFASSGRSQEYLEKHFPGRVIEIRSLSISMKGNTVDVFTTVLSNVLTVAMNVFDPVDQKVRKLRPDIVISDFDPQTARFALSNKLPLLAIDHPHFVSKCRHPPSVIRKEDRASAAIAFAISDNMMRADRYLLVSFVDAACPPDTTIHLPTLRKEIMALKEKGVSKGEHVVGYFNLKADHDQLQKTFSQVPEVEFRIYGRKGQKHRERLGNVVVCPVSEQEFFEDLASCRAVIGGAGFNFMSEAIYLHKPMMALPFAGHFEQILNANYLELLGYGERADEVTVEGVRRFLGRLDKYQERVRSFKHDNNVELLSSIDTALHDLSNRTRNRPALKWD